MSSRSIVLLIASLLMGCDQLSSQVLERYRQGTVAGVELCAKNSASELIPKEVTLERCVEKHSKLKDSLNVTGRCGYIPYGGPDKVQFAGRLENGSKNTVITKIVLRVEHQDHKGPDGKHEAELFTLDHLWLMPGRNEIFARPTTFTPAPDRIKGSEKEKMWAWQIDKVYGVAM